MRAIGCTLLVTHAHGRMKCERARLLLRRRRMPNIVRQKVSLQLLSLYLLFVIPVLLGGGGLYLFQRNTLEQNAFQSDQGLAQAVALETGAYVQSASEIDRELATSQAATSLDPRQLNSLFSSAFGAHPDISMYFILDPTGKMKFNYPSNQISIV